MGTKLVYLMGTMKGSLAIVITSALTVAVCSPGFGQNRRDRSERSSEAPPTSFSPRINPFASSPGPGPASAPSGSQSRAVRRGDPFGVQAEPGSGAPRSVRRASETPAGFGPEIPATARPSTRPGAARERVIVSPESYEATPSRARTAAPSGSARTRATAPAASSIEEQAPARQTATRSTARDRRTEVPARSEAAAPLPEGRVFAEEPIAEPTRTRRSWTSMIPFVGGRDDAQPSDAPSYSPSRLSRIGEPAVAGVGTETLPSPAETLPAYDPRRAAPAEADYGARSTRYGLPMNQGYEVREANNNPALDNMRRILPGYDLPSATVSEVHSDIHSGSSRLRTAFEASDEGGLEQSLDELRTHVETMDGRLRDAPRESRFCIPSIERMYRTAIGQIEQGVETGQDEKIQLGLQNLEIANEELEKIRH